MLLGNAHKTLQTHTKLFLKLNLCNHIPTSHKKLQFRVLDIQPNDSKNKAKAMCHNRMYRKFQIPPTYRL